MNDDEKSAGNWYVSKHMTEELADKYGPAEHKKTVIMIPLNWIFKSLKRVISRKKP